MARSESAGRCVLTLPLHTQPWQENILETRFSIVERLKNSLIAKEQHRLYKLQRTKKYRALMEKINNTPKNERKSLWAERRKMLTDAGFTEFDFKNAIFSPTGGSEKVADILANALGTEIETIDLSANNFSGHSLPGDGVAVIAMPSFGGRAPEIAIKRLKMINGNRSKAVAVAVYGNREQEDTLIEIADTAVECGFEVIAGIAAVAEHSIAHQYASGRPDEDDSRQLATFAGAIKEKLSDNAPPPHIPGNRPYKKPGAGMVPKTTSACIGCGLCAEKCPVGAIEPSDPKKTDKNSCINCMRCVAICPKNAKTVSPLMAKLVGVALKKACTDRKDNILYI